MLVQADDDYYYEDPIIGNQYWRFWFAVDCYFAMVMVGKNQLERQKIANGICRQWLVLKLNSDVRSGVGFGKRIEDCRLWKVKIINVIPHEMILEADGRFTQDEVKKIIDNGRDSSVIRFHWKYSRSEIERIWNGEFSGYLEWGSDLLWYRRKLIRKQLNIKSIEELREGEYVLGKGVPIYEWQLLKGNLWKMFGGIINKGDLR